MNSPNVPSVPTFSTASEFLAGQFSPSRSTALNFQLADFQKCNRDEFIHEKSPLHGHRDGFIHGKSPPQNYRNQFIHGKLPPQNCVDPKVFLKSMDSSGDECDRLRDNQADQDGCQSVDNSSTLPPRILRKTASQSSFSSMSKYGNANYSNRSEKGSSDSETVDQSMVVDPKEPTPGSRVAENDAIEGENGPRGGRDNTEVAVDPVDDVEQKKLTSDPMDVDEAVTGDEEVDGVKTKKPSSDLDLVKEGRCASGNRGKSDLAI